MSTRNHVACVLTIGGLDPSGGAGIPADARAIPAFGAHPCAVATAIVAQNTRGVAQIEMVSDEILRAQLRNLLEDVTPRAVKIGLIASAEQVQILLENLENAAFQNEIPVVLDPVFAPSAGAAFSDLATIRAIAENLLPRCALVTPNAIEAAQLCGFSVQNLDDMKDAARAIHEKFGAHRVLVKGGHLAETAHEVVDVLWQNGAITEFRAPRLAGIEVRGTGCLLASAMAAQLAQNIEIETAIRAAKSWLSQQIENAQQIGGGRRVAI